MSMFFQLAETFHGKFGYAIFVATPLPRFGKDEFRKLLTFATETSGYYSDLRGGDKIAGFQFKRPEDRSSFLVRARRMALESQPPAFAKKQASYVYADGKMNKGMSVGRGIVVVRSGLNAVA